MNNTSNSEITDRMIENATELKIISGEGENGTVEIYTGKRTARAVKARLTKERCNGDRWATLEVDGRRI